MESIYLISLTFICAFFDYEYKFVDCQKSEGQFGNANLYTEDNKTIHYSRTSKRWINIPDLLNSLQSKKIKEFCYSGT